MNWLRRYEGWLHAVGWLVFISLPLLTLPDFLRNRQDLLSLGMAQLLTSLLTMLCFYHNLRTLTPALLRHEPAQRFWLTLAMMLASVVLVKVASFYVFPPAFNPPPTGPPPGLSHVAPPGPGPRSPWPGVPGTVVSFGFAMTVASMIALFRHHLRGEETRQQMALEKVSTELAMLKLQVSPHFLFNTLNNIRWLARQKSDQTETAVTTLAQLLRYMIYQARHDRVPLRQEVEHLRHYVALQQMRLTDRHPVRFDVVGPIDNYQIEPLLFIPLVENAFKYGTQQPEGQICIWLYVADHGLEFGTDNPRPATQLPGAPEPGNWVADSDSGVGVANVRQRLALHYPAAHSLRIGETAGRFRVTLTLTLSHA